MQSIHRRKAAGERAPDAAQCPGCPAESSNPGEIRRDNSQGWVLCLPVESKVAIQAPGVGTVIMVIVIGHFTTCCAKCPT